MTVGRTVWDFIMESAEGKGPRSMGIALLFLIAIILLLVFLLLLGGFVEVRLRYGGIEVLIDSASAFPLFVS